MLEKFLLKSLVSVLIFIILNTNQCTDGFYVPGVAPQDFAKGDIVEVKVNTLSLFIRINLLICYLFQYLFIGC